MSTIPPLVLTPMPPPPSYPSSTQYPSVANYPMPGSLVLVPKPLQ